MFLYLFLPLSRSFGVKKALGLCRIWAGSEPRTSTRSGPCFPCSFPAGSSFFPPLLPSEHDWLVKTNFSRILFKNLHHLQGEGNICSSWKYKRILLFCKNCFCGKRGNVGGASKARDLGSPLGTLWMVNTPSPFGREATSLSNRIRRCDVFFRYRSFFR